MKTRPGGIVLKARIYRVVHAAHRSPHEVMLRLGEILPICRICGEHLRFELIDPADGGKPEAPAGKKCGAILACLNPHR
jgi:hypothetical protein